MRLIRTHGFTATTVDELCDDARVTKGAFFHHFVSKEAFGVAAAEHWSLTTGALFARAQYHAASDPLDRVLAYIDLRRALLRGAIADFTCVAGTMVQDTWESSPAIRAACDASISEHAQTLEADIAAAKRKYGIAGAWSASSLALHTQAVLQGAFVLAKAKGDAAVAIDSVDHLRRYIELLFKPATLKTGRTRMDKGRRRMKR